MRDLPAKLRADRTGGTGNHHRPPDDVLADTVFLQSPRIATQQVVGRDVTNLSTKYLAVKQLTQTGNGFANDTADTTIGQGFPKLASVGRRHSDNNFLYPGRTSLIAIHQGGHISSSP